MVSIERLKELVRVVNGNKIKRIAVLDLRNKRAGKINDLYRALSSGKISTDKEARALLFADATPSALSNAKRKLKERLLDTVFFIDVKNRDYTDRQKAFYELQRKHAAANLLYARGAKNVAQELMEEIIEKSVEFEFNNLILDNARVLRIQYGVLDPDPERFVEMDAHCREAGEKLRQESFAEHCYADLHAQYLGQKEKDRVYLRGLANKYWYDLRDNFARSEDYGFRIHALPIRLFRHTISNDYISCVSICQEEIAFLEGKTYQANTALSLPYYHLMVGCLQKGDYATARHYAAKSEKLSEAGTVNWFIYREILFLLAMYNENYQDAYAYYLELSQPEFKDSQEVQKFNLPVYRAYLQFLADKGKIEVAVAEQDFQFEPSVFRRSMREALKNDSLVNFSVIILQLLFALRQRNYEFIFDNGENIRKLLRRYRLKQDYSRRATLFVQLLLLRAQKDFQPNNYEVKIDRVLAEMSETDRSRENPHFKIEVVPFETLWELIV